MLADFNLRSSIKTVLLLLLVAVVKWTLVFSLWLLLSGHFEMEARAVRWIQTAIAKSRQQDSSEKQTHRKVSSVDS